MVPKLEKAKQNRAAMALEAENVPSENIPGYGVCKLKYCCVYVCITIYVYISHVTFGLFNADTWTENE